MKLFYWFPGICLFIRDTLPVARVVAEDDDDGGGRCTDGWILPLGADAPAAVDDGDVLLVVNALLDRCFVMCDCGLAPESEESLVGAVAVGVNRFVDAETREVPRVEAL